jgi:uncharacterized membrane protein YoaK (UPF0700 family)
MSGDYAGAGTRSRPAGQRIRDGLVVLLAVGSGAVNVTSFLALGTVFSSVITGNLVLLGLAAASTQHGPALRSGLALVGYSAGVLIGAPIAARGRVKTWSPAVTAALCAELCLLLGFTAGWEADRQRQGWQLVLLMLLAAAMGLQSAAVRRLGDMSSTHLTGVLAGVLAGLVGAGSSAGRWRDVSVLVAFVAGASAGAALIRLAPGWLPALTLLPLGTVIATACMFRWESTASDN